MHPAPKLGSQFGMLESQICSLDVGPGRTRAGRKCSVQIRETDILRRPFARSVNLTTKTNWEGTGVTPDVHVKSTEALQAAQRLAVDKIHAKSTSK